MKKHCIVSVAKLGIICLLAPAIVFATPGEIPQLLVSSCDPLSSLDVGEPVLFRLIYLPNEDYPTAIAHVTVTTKGNIEYRGPTEWSVDFTQQFACTTLFELVISEGDTSGVVFDFDLDEHQWQINRFFVTTGDTLEYYHGDITHNFGLANSSLIGRRGKKWTPSDTTREKLGQKAEIEAAQPNQIKERGKIESSQHLIRRVIPSQRPYINIDLQPLDMASTGGPVDFQLSIETEKRAKSIDIYIVVSDNVSYSGLKKWTKETQGRKEFVFPLHAIIPPGDTSYISVQVITL